MNLADIKTVEKLLKPLGFSFKKSLGQNFLIDSSVCPAMAESCADEYTGVLEIGPGIGVLTVECARVAKKVVAIELDRRLQPVLDTTLAPFDNAEVVFGDALKLDLNALIKEKFADCNRVVVCANLPYYITSPIIMMLLESKLNIDSITVMVQKEAAERLCAKVGTRNAGAVTVAVAYYAQPQILFEVERTSFMPEPNVDSAVIQLKVLSEPRQKVKDEKFFFSFVKACFAQRRKTLVNTVSNTLCVPKDKITKALSEMGLEATVRSEVLTFEQLAELSDLLCD
ncbi:MAG: 16S rRNA (adenine(1518)-N(6)/adenine(1519)-N(6))-dimethyltransferase RsmA [Acutalibacteraceae bacterium]|nr:16S rRNA (adenine(1518)-N(6)/adenine(1519)-N(6))-dimethyltransferase RsmA [Acutalibacteraceae bacterium]